MKSINYIITIILVFLIGIITVNAEFGLDWNGVIIKDRMHGYINEDLSVFDAELGGEYVCTATVTNNCFVIEKNFYSNDLTPTPDVPKATVYYKGNLSFGTTNELSKSFTLTWDDAVTLENGTKKNLILTISVNEIWLPTLDSVKAKYPTTGNNGTTANQKYQDLQQTQNLIVPIVRGNNMVELVGLYPLLSVPTSESVATDAELQIVRGNKYTIKLAVEGQEQNSSSYLGFGIRDLDTRDTRYVSTETTDEAKRIDQYRNRPYVESIELLDGFNSTVYLAKQQPQGQDPIRGYSYLSVTNHRFYPNGEIYQHSSFEDLDPYLNHADHNTYASGFITRASMSESTFAWTGTHCGTTILGSQIVRIIQTHTDGGTVKILNYFGKDRVLEKEEDNIHLIGSTPVYDYAPNKGYHVVSVKVNGEEVDIAKDYKYTFDVLKFNGFGDIGNEYTIDIVYAKDAGSVVPNPKTGIAAIGGLVIASIGIGSAIYIKKKKYTE